MLKATGSASAVSMFAKEKPGSVILDIMMPDISGLEVLSYLRREPKLAKILFVAVSAKSTSADIRNGQDAGASVYMTKPVSYLDLKDALEKALGT